MRSSIQLRKHDNRKNSGGGGWRCQGQLPKKFAIAHIIKPLPPHFWLPPAPFLVQISHPPIIVMFEKLNPHPFIKGPGGGGKFKLWRPWMDVVHCPYYSKYYFIFTFFGNLHVNNGVIVAKYFKRIKVKMYTANLYLWCNIYKILLHFLRGKKWRLKLSGNLAVYCICFSTSIL